MVSLPLPPRAKKELAQLRAEDRKLLVLKKNDKRFVAKAHKLRSLLTDLKKITGAPRKKRR